MALGPMSSSVAMTRRTDVPPPTFYERRHSRGSCGPRWQTPDPWAGEPGRAYLTDADVVAPLAFDDGRVVVDVQDVDGEGVVRVPGR